MLASESVLIMMDLYFFPRARVRNSSCEQRSIPLRRPVACAQRLTGAPAPAAMARSTRKPACARRVFILNSDGRANCTRSGDIPPKLNEVGMRDDPVGDIDSEFIGCIACTGSCDEHKIPRAVVCRGRVGRCSKRQERSCNGAKSDHLHGWSSPVIFISSITLRHLFKAASLTA